MIRYSFKINQFQAMKKLLLRIIFIGQFIINSILIMVFSPIAYYLENVSDEIKYHFKVLLTKAPQEVRSMFPNTFDHNGLKFNLQYLKEIFNSVAKMTIEEQAKYADYKTVQFVEFWNNKNEGNKSDERYFDEQKNKMLAAVYADLNTTSVGNMAYIAQKLISNEKTSWFPNYCF